MKKLIVAMLLACVATLAFAQMNMGGEGEMSAMEGMHMMPVTDEYSFIAGMIPHHQEAVDTSLVMLSNSHRPEMQAFAWEIVKVQMAEIVMMHGWLDSWYADRGEEVMYMPMMREQAGLEADELDRAFLEDMIVHHEMAVVMAEQLLENDYAENPSVAALAHAIIETQSEEIAMMRTWLEDWF
ncbi:MAG: DUF305 domain-containing protein [Trueperaceae bacterium]|nr:MAG: DUF305 domain-containing protein [Trueperaceae bacterium]